MTPRPAAAGASLLALLLALSAGAAPAQPTSEAEELTPYATLRGWDVFSVRVDGYFVACRGAHYGDSGPLMIDRGSEGWMLLAANPANTGGELFTGAVLTIDGAVTDAQVGLDYTYWSRMDLSDDQLARLRNGARLTLAATGAPPVSAALDGSAAMLLKVQECHDRNAPPKQAFDMKVIRFPGGRYEYLHDYSWAEIGDNGSRFEFTQTDGNETEIFLQDPSRGLRITINLADDTIYSAGPGAAFRPLYPVISAE